MTTRLVVVGAGGFGRETLDVIDALAALGGTYEVEGVVDDAPSEVNLERLAARGVRHLGELLAWFERRTPTDYVLAIGDPTVRRELVGRLDDAGMQPVTLVHPAAVVGSVAGVGAGSVICAGVQVSTNVRIGRHVHLNPNATIGHDTVLHDFVSVNPGAVVSGDCVVAEGALLGAGSVVLQGLAIGASAVVGAAACVTRDVPSAAVVKGVPAR